MKRIRCIGDSNTYGYDPESGRYPRHIRWTGRLAETGYNVINDGQNGRCIPAGFSGRTDADTVLVMLGTNDLLQELAAEEAGRKMEAYIRDMKRHCTSADIVLVCPPLLRYGDWVHSARVTEESVRLSGIYRDLAKRCGIRFADAGEWNLSVGADGVHLTEKGHAVFADRIGALIGKEAAVLYHASPYGDLNVLKPHMSMHGIPLVYLSKKRENVLVYLSNAVKKYARKTGFAYDGPWSSWGPYGFEKDGRMRLEEYYPGAFETTYAGVPGYIYTVTVTDICDPGEETGIRDVRTSRKEIPVCGREYVPNALSALQEAEEAGKIVLVRYGEQTDQKKEWIRKTVKKEYEEAQDHPEYRHFLRGMFPELFRGEEYEF